MKKSDHGLEIVRVSNGFSIRDSEGEVTVVEDERQGDLSAAEKLLWEIINFFDLRGDRYDRERVAIIREAGDKYSLQKDERILKESYCRVVKKTKKPDS